MEKKVLIYDTTLRDGTQAEGVNVSVEDKLRITEKLDDFGIHYIEGGWPGSNPKDDQYFKEVKKLNLKNSKIAAFGSTRRAYLKVEDDPLVQNLVKAETPVITIFGKSWDIHVTQALKTDLEKNLEMVFDTVQFLKKHTDEVVFIGEHFFDGYKSNPEYAVKVLNAASEGGADFLVLADTNGGTLPNEIERIIKEVKERGINNRLGIHAHNDSDTAVWNSIVAVLNGAVQVHGTINGFGERCGNANLCSIIPDLTLKLGYETIPRENIKRLKEISNFVADLVNLPVPKNMPYVGDSAFAHKGGVHASAVIKNSRLYEHIDPEQVGNRRKILVSDLAGKSNIIYKARELGIQLDEKDPRIAELVREIKQLENYGYHFEAAEASLELLIRKHLGMLKKYFDLDAYRVLIARRYTDKEPVSEATVRIKIDNHYEHTASLGYGPVNALDRALKKALVGIYPSLAEVELIDYKVRIVNETAGTAAKIRVLVESKDREKKWGTVGVSDNIIEASWQAVVDSFIYKLMKDGV
ncbi:MAG TPA: citramalate synthase [Persephonella sp.]|uniref:Citramalate synthase n=1 Tax=Persephonella marina (strain DSM 14350 / EX-H1) TaxID=123214 RepID=C0QQB9_PERMH|nr:MULTISPECIES: citramalate synthase [Persephonella]ACO03396.1 2-isopropylmalate synthase/homocitrate synthase family protein [Persephonella marina EX-H1]HCB69529.1 citramalate synthase [Persephonella sp.]